MLPRAERSGNHLSPRRAVPADAPALNQLARAAYAVYVPVIGRAPVPMAVDWATLFASHEIWIVDHESGDVAASLALEVHGDHVLIWSVAVAPARQNRGIGAELMKFAERRSRELGRPELRLYTNELMAGNVARYLRLGYVETRRERMTDRVLVHMSKRLAPSG
jgi:GNAT superfamily N-acetyltransferase